MTQLSRWATTYLLVLVGNLSTEGQGGGVKNGDVGDVDQDEGGGGVDAKEKAIVSEQMSRPRVRIYLRPGQSGRLMGTRAP
ncbi:hypothetical protein Pyn_37407 [Prunus yedoensis var. nudiflora]|uniref:Secreted protein n=1 Tax=Prunus yedoensis var. nudiflora TaxID=2094558 RepID=A0A314U9G4_PRUYE|nr:hypothetical protein Pyn_37407 [Prunus yedoensis var. nudiflora]